MSAAALTLGLALTACGAGYSSSEPIPATTTPTGTAPAPAPSTVSFQAVDESGYFGPCFDGSCTLTVTAPATIPVDAAVFGFPEVIVSEVTSDSVTWEAYGPGTTLRGTTGAGGTTTLSTGSSTPITMRPLSFDDDAATIELFPGRP
ncbi:hypothetical protein [Nocardia sp. NPDC051750]|uniref:hypothetical protein n=1 Tax=Nocardia sp. NPDC051750 TaxID=3364325 RepID=UPI003798BAA5